MSTQKQRSTFISYSRVNKDFALKLARELRESGFNIWLDQLDIPAGARWDDEVEHALDICEIFMVILTPASSTSDNVKDEIGYAIDTRKRILPILLENASVPLRLRRFQYVDFTSKSFDEGVEGAKQLLRNLIDEPTLPRMEIPPEVQVEIEKQKSRTESTAQDQAEIDRKAKEEAERLHKEETEAKALAAAKSEAERKAKEQAEQPARQPVSETSATQKQEPEQRPVQPKSPPPPATVVQKPERARRATGKKSRLPLLLGGVGLFGAGFVVVAVLLGARFLGGLAPGDNSPTEIPSQAPMNELVDDPVEAALPTHTSPPPTAIPTAKPTATRVTPPTETGPTEFFTTEFNSSTEYDDWEYFEIGSGNESKLDITPLEDGLLFNLNDHDLYVYYIYTPVTYEDVALRITAENLGQNTNNVSLVCRRTGDTWYEISVTSGGEWYLYNYDSDYHTVDNGGTTAVRYGKTTNEYEMICKGNSISLRINGEEVKTVRVNNNLYTEGQVGFNISSLGVVPIDIKVIDFEISEP